MIKVEGIRKVFNRGTRSANEVLKGVSFELPDKGLVAIFGKSGSGKTTLLNIIGGLDKQNQGKIFIDNENVAGKVDKIRNAKIGFIFQNYYLESGYTIEEIMHNAMIIAGFKDKKEIKNRTEQVLKLVKMDRYKNKTADALSGGQKQRVAIARALIKGSDVILADEPTGNLDSENTIIIMDILKEISKTQLVVLVTHEVNLIYQYADSHIKLVDGEVVNDATLDAKIETEVEKNNIYANKLSKRSLKLDETNLKIYGDNIKSSDIEIFSDNGSVYIRPGKGVKILDENSEKKVIFEEPKDEKETFDEVPKFEKSTSKRNGRLFKFKNIWKSRHYNGEEKAYSTSNIFKQIYLVAMAATMAFCSFAICEKLNDKVDTKPISESSVYLDMKEYQEITRINPDFYDSIDFFETNYQIGEFAYEKQLEISTIKSKFTPTSLNIGESKEEAKLQFGEMPKDNEVLVSRRLADDLKKELRYEEFQTDQSILLLNFNKNYHISGICEGNEPNIYFNRTDYINYLNIYNELKIVDGRNIFFEKDFTVEGKGETKYEYSAEICLYEGETLDLKKNQGVVEINRGSTLKMMKDSKDADYKIDVANKKLLKTPEYISINNSYPLYIRQFKLNRKEMSTDIRLYVTKECLNNIFTYISPNLDNLDKTTSYFFEVKTSTNEQLNNLEKRLKDRFIDQIDINKLYLDQQKEINNQFMITIYILLSVSSLLYIIYYFVEKSSSLKNSKEYGVFRAIGINKSNLLYKETILTLKHSLITYLICSILFITLVAIRYFVMNLNVLLFIGIASLITLISLILMTCISLIPYLFVLYKTPSEIISRYDI